MLALSVLKADFSSDRPKTTKIIWPLTHKVEHSLFYSHWMNLNKLSKILIIFHWIRLCSRRIRPFSVEYYNIFTTKKKIEYNKNGKRSCKVNLGLHCSIINASTLHPNDLLLAHNRIYWTLLFVLLANNNPHPFLAAVAFDRAKHSSVLRHRNPLTKQCPAQRLQLLRMYISWARCSMLDVRTWTRTCCVVPRESTINFHNQNVWRFLLNILSMCKLFHSYTFRWPRFLCPCPVV